MRNTVVIPLLLCTFASSLAAQERRLTIVPSVGYHLVSPLFEHAVEYVHPEAGELQRSEQLEIEETRSIGALVSYRFADAWLIYGEARHGETAFRYRYEARSGRGIDEFEVWSSDAALTTFELGIGRSVRFHPGSPDLEARLGGVLSRARVGDGTLDCFTGGPPCPTAHHEKRYDMPGIVGSLEAAQRINSRIGIRAGAAYALLRANTENFRIGYPPEYEHLEAPGWHRVSIFRFSAGVSVAF